MTEQQKQWSELSVRERQAAIIVAQGYNRHDGAVQMEVATKTFDHHRLEALNKLELGNAVQLLWFCLDGEILDTNGDLIFEVEIN
jgi:DNA-binding CsgD family transcriptional regulator